MPQYFDSTAARPMKTKRKVYAKGGRIGAKKGGHVKSMGIAKRGGGVAKR